jgi:hypothetical protein
VLRLGRPAVDLQERELGAQEPDAFGAGIERQSQLGRSCDIGEHRDPPPVERRCRDCALLGGVFAGARPPRRRAAGVLHALRGGLGEYDALAAVDHDQCAVGEGEHGVAELRDERDRKRARDDRGVRRRAAARERDGLHACFQLGDVGRPEVLGHEHDIASLDARRRRSGGQRRRPAPQAAHIVGASREQLVRQRGQEVGLR